MFSMKMKLVEDQDEENRMDDIMLIEEEPP